MPQEKESSTGPVEHLRQRTRRNDNKQEDRSSTLSTSTRADSLSKSTSYTKTKANLNSKVRENEPNKPKLKYPSHKVQEAQEGASHKQKNSHQVL